jgi:hypothetical protein
MGGKVLLLWDLIVICSPLVLKLNIVKMKKFIFALLSVVTLVVFSVSVSIGSHEIPKPDVVKIEKSAVVSHINLASVEVLGEFSPGDLGSSIIFAAEKANFGYLSIKPEAKLLGNRYGAVQESLLYLNNKPLGNLNYKICARHKC